MPRVPLNYAVVCKGIVAAFEQLASRWRGGTRYLNLHLGVFILHSSSYAF